MHSISKIFKKSQKFTAEQITDRYTTYEEVVRKVSNETGLCGPHCDNLVLHAPGECEYCDKPYFAELHEARKELVINYTGDYDPTKYRCPAEIRRPLGNINHWGGNVATNSEERIISGKDYIT